MRRVLRRLWVLFRIERLDRELDEELHFHVDMDADALMRAGLARTGRAWPADIPDRDVAGLHDLDRAG